MTENWVGFAGTPKPDLNREIHTFSFELACPRPYSEGHQIFTTPAGLGNWLGEVAKFDFRAGAKIKYEHDYQVFGATYAEIRIPKSVVLVTETLGEVSFDSQVADESFDLKVSFQKALLEEEIEDWEKLVTRAQNEITKALS